MHVQCTAGCDSCEIAVTHVARSLGQGTSVDNRYGLAHHVVVHIIEHDDIGACIECLFELIEGTDFDFDANHMSDMFPKLCDSGEDSAAGVNMVVL